MYLKRLDIYGFKSFGVRTRLEFVPGITAVVGPNGSGKSNIADAIRWVLGEQSPKTLRGSRMEDVIFAGSDGKRPLGYADVSLTLDNSDGYFPLDFSEITITRRVFRSGESQYLINQTRCRLKDVQELFMDTGLGKNTYALIGQGQIDQILSARPEERRRLIEEAAGVVKYRSRRAEAQRKLEDTEQHLLRVNDIIFELERQLQPLKEEAQKAKRYLELSGQLKDTELGLFAAQWVEIDKERQVVAAQIRQNQADLDAVHQDNCRLEKEIAEQKGLVQGLEAKLEEVSQSAALHSQALNDSEHEKSLAQAQLEHTQQQISSLIRELHRLEHKSSSLSEEYTKAEAELSQLDSQIADAQRRKEEVEGAAGEFLVDVAEKEHTLSQLRDDYELLGGQLAKFSELLISLRERIHSLSSRRSDARKRLTQIRQDKQQAEEAAASLALEYEARTSEIRRLQEDVQGIEREIQRHRLTLKELEHHQRSLEGKLGSLRSRWKVLKEMEYEYEGYSRGVKVVMRAASQGRLPDLMGTVAEVIRVPNHLVTALETALGSSLQNVVAKTREAGQKAIEFLKESGAGRITVLPLDGLRYSVLTEAERERLSGLFGVVGVAADLIEAGAEFTPVVQYLLGRVIVTQDLRAAVAVSKRLKSFGRIVTLDGDQISPGGAMSGGSPPKQRTSGLLTRQQELSSLTEAAKTVKEQLQETAEKVAASTQTLTRLDDKKRELQQRLQELEISKAALERDLAAALAQHERLSSVEAEVLTEEAGLNKQLQELIAKEEETKAEAEEVQSRQETVMGQINQLESQLVQAREKRGQVEAEVTSVRVDLAALTGQAESARERLRGLQERMEEVHGSQRERQQEIDDLRQKEQELIRRIDELSHQTKKSAEKLKIAREEQERLKQELQAYRRRLESLLEELDLGRETAGQLQMALHEHQRREDKLGLQAEHLIEQVWQDYEISREELTSKVEPVSDLPGARRKAAYLREQLRELGPVNLNASEEFDAVEERYRFLCQQRDDLVESRRSLHKAIGEMDRVSSERFLATFNRVRSSFQSIFSRLFGGGSADLVLTDPSDLQQSGLEIMAQPPGKKLQNLDLLSGGERALAAVAFLFAMLSERPSPFCVLDEVDAALDEANLSRFAQLLREFTGDVQFLVITHRQGTMELADVLYGVTMGGDGISKLVSVRLADQEEPVAAVSDYMQ